MKSTYPSDGFAGFAINGKARIIGAVKQGVAWNSAKGVEPLFATTEADLLAFIAAKGYTVVPLA
jgi:hypothetical protein